MAKQRERKDASVFVSVRRYRVGEPAATVGRRVEQGLVPLVVQSPGFLSYAVLDAGGGQLVTITVCADQAGTEVAERRAAAWLAAHLPALVALPDGADGGVLVHAGYSFDPPPANPSWPAAGSTG